MKKFAVVLIMYGATSLLAQVPAGQTEETPARYGGEILAVYQWQPDAFSLTTTFRGSRVGEFEPVTVSSGPVRSMNFWMQGYAWLGKARKVRASGGINITAPITRDLPPTRFHLVRKPRVGPLVQLEYKPWQKWSVFAGYTDSRFLLVNPLGREITLDVHQPHIGFKREIGRLTVAVHGGPNYGRESLAEDRVAANNQYHAGITVGYRIFK